MIRKNLLFMAGLLGAAFLVSSGCKETNYDELGAACDDGSACEDVCHTGFPGGMCTTSCDADNPCDEGVCVTFSDGGWCLPECSDNSECRTDEGYSCILGTCRPKSEGGAPCDDNDDCGEGLSCMEGMCTHQCVRSRDCNDVEGAYCTANAEGTELWCLPGIVDPNMNVPCFNEEGNDTCAEGYVCYPGPSALEAYCTTECESNRDCVPGMVCRGVDTAEGIKQMCVQADYCEPCNTDDECGTVNDKCIGSDPSKATENYCSMACDPNHDSCPTDSKCTAVYFCESSHSWVPDCAWCSGECSESVVSHQCVPDYGACVGDGTLCTPCRNTDTCQNGDGGYCLTSLDNAFCTKPCDTDDECPEGYMCYDIGVSKKQCIPGNTSCTNPQIPQQ